MILLTHPTGNMFSRALLGALVERGKLGLFATTLAVSGSESWLELLPRRLRDECLRRQFNVPEGKLYSRPGREIVRLAKGRLGLSADVDPIYRDLGHALADRLPAIAHEHSITGIYAYEDGACETFRRAQDLGLKRFYDLPIAYWETTQRLLREEAERLPEWKATLAGLNDSEEKLRRKSGEAELAEVIVCPSRFVLDSLPAKLRETRRCVLAEFGSPINPTQPSFDGGAKKLRILFAGSMSQRKGLADVFAAMKLLKRSDVELVVMGSMLAPMEFYRSGFPDFIYEPPRPHAEVLKLMESCDALLLPSIVEGRALVQQEAMSRGLALIATANAGAQELIEDDKTGFLVPIRSPESIAERVAWIADNRAALTEIKRAAFEKATALTWRSYTDKILAAIDGVSESGRGAKKSGVATDQTHA